MVLTITDMLRQHGVVGKFVEFYGDGIASVPLANRATIGNMGPESAPPAAFSQSTRHSRLSALDWPFRRTDRIGRSVCQGEQAVGRHHRSKLRRTAVFRIPGTRPRYCRTSIAGPKRPQDRIKLSESKAKFVETLPAYETDKTVQEPVAVSTDFRGDFDITNGDVAIASITSCTNTSNPSVMIAAGLIARNAHAKGLKPKPWVKTSLAPGSQVVADYLKAAGLQDDLDALGYQLVGFGCATCIGNSGPLLPEISEAINANDLTVTSVLSGNRNFEGRISGRQDELPGISAARHRLCARWHHGFRF